VGAYGSPELPPNNTKDNNNGYQYQSSYQSPYKPNNPKSENGGCLKNGLILLGLLSLFFVIFSFASYMISGGNSAVKVGNIKATTSSPVYSPPFSTSPVSSVPAVVEDSTDYLQSWAKTVVVKCLVYSDTAKFSDDLSDWKFVRDGKMCEISSVVYARGKNTKENVKNTFIVRISYTDLKAEVTYIAVNDKVCYDDSKSSKSK